MNNNFILSLLTLFLIFLLSVIDESTATLSAGIFVIFTGCFLCLSVDKSHKNGAFKKTTSNYRLFKYYEVLKAA